MDIIDEKIIGELNNDARATASQISKAVNLSSAAVGERIRKLEANGTITNYTVRVDREKTNYKLLAFISVTLDNPKNIDIFKKNIVKQQAVLELHHIVGDYDYLLKVLLVDTKELEFFLTNVLKKIPGVIKSNTVISLAQIKEVINRTDYIGGGK